MIRLSGFCILLLCGSLISETICRRTEVVKDGEFEFEWEVEDGSITITLIGKTLGYLGFGISPHGSMMEADLMLAGRRNNGSGYIQDLNAFANASPIRDVSQDVHLLSAKENATHTTVTFSRKLDTGDVEEDIPITNNTQFIIWAFGPTDSSMYHGPNRGTVPLNLLHP